MGELLVPWHEGWDVRRTRVDHFRHEITAEPMVRGLVWPLKQAGFAASVPRSNDGR